MNQLPSWARPGQKIVCIAAGGRWQIVDGDGRLDGNPLFGLTYTIRSVEAFEGDWYLGLVELADGEFGVGAFRPVVDDTIEAGLFAQRQVLEVVR